jgi:hypothetical protein
MIKAAYTLASKFSPSLANSCSLTVAMSPKFSMLLASHQIGASENLIRYIKSSLVLSMLQIILSKRQQQQQQQQHSDNKHVPARITARELMPLDPGRPSLALLPDHVVLLILSFVHESSLDDLLKIAALSSALYEMARYVQYHTLHINLNRSIQARSRLGVLSRNLLFTAVRVLEVSGSRYDLQQREEVEGNEVLIHLAEVLPAMTGLRDFHWRVKSKKSIQLHLRREATVPMPLLMLKHIPRRTRLHISLTSEDALHHPDQTQAREFLAELVDNQNLFSLSIQVSYFEQFECQQTMRALKRVLLSCPNLVRIPHINVGYPTGRAYRKYW